MSSSPLLETRALGRIAAERPLPLLAPTDFTLRAGERVTVIGASGSGKSLFLRALALLDEADSGELLWQGQPVPAAAVPRYRTQVGYLAQRPALVDGTVLDNLRLPFSLKALGQRRFNPRTVQGLLEQAGKPATFVDKAATELSGGEAQIVALIRLLQLEPEVILFDEPTAALDPQSAAAVERLVLNWFDAAAQNRALVWVTHDLEQARRIGTRQLTMTQGVLQP